MGTLLDKIARTGNATAPRMGFSMPSTDRRAAMILIAVLDTPDSAAASAAVSSGADAVLVTQSAAKKSKARLSEQLKLADATPCGAPPSAGDPTALDFTVLDLADPIAAIQSSGDLDRILRLPTDLSAATLRTLEALPVEAFALPAPGEPLTLDRMLPYYRVSASTRKPVLATVPPTASRETLIALRDAGISGILVEGSAKQIAALHELLLGLPVRKHRGEGSRHTVKLGLPPYQEPAPVADDDGDDEDDEE